MVRNNVIIKSYFEIGSIFEAEPGFQEPIRYHILHTKNIVIIRKVTITISSAHAARNDKIGEEIRAASQEKHLDWKYCYIIMHSLN